MMYAQAEAAELPSFDFPIFQFTTPQLGNSSDSADVAPLNEQQNQLACSNVLQKPKILSSIASEASTSESVETSTKIFQFKVSWKQQWSVR